MQLAFEFAWRVYCIVQNKYACTRRVQIKSFRRLFLAFGRRPLKTVPVGAEAGVPLMPLATESLHIWLPGLLLELSHHRGLEAFHPNYGPLPLSTRERHTVRSPDCNGYVPTPSNATWPRLHEPHTDRYCFHGVPWHLCDHAVTVGSSPQ
jgi:hypothetical protein